MEMVLYRDSAGNTVVSVQYHLHTIINC